ncbi:MAG: LpqB family beta-propeller domain-containing protein [Actinomycetota bacterium]|nr:LpqB family beta-propeller domain-containing protein [Actinomycetota bacterium]MDA3003359.1 LpqB family beta-propeller domain-containing protein [Actinomycetota bacterium]
MRALNLGVLAFLSVLLMACTAIPSSGPVNSTDRTTGIDVSDVDFLPPGPSTGATPEEIIAGFIAAGTAAQDNYRVARSYLAEEVEEDWNPNASVLIRRGEPLISVVSNTVARYVAPVIASVDELGRFSASPSVSSQTLDFRLVREDGEWRISGLADGIVLTEAAFAEAFSSYRLYYFSAGYRELVPDIRWFASRGEVSSKIVRGLLEAPSFWLDQGATVTAFPEGTQLALTPVSVVDGVASVDLTTRVLTADEITRSRMITQLTASLSQVQGISSARISVNQNDLVITPLGEEGPTLASGRDPRSVVFRDRRFGYVQGGSVQEIEGLSSEVASLIPQRVFYSSVFDRALATRTDGLWSLEPGREPVIIDPRADLVRGIIDNCGFVWSSTKEASPEMAQIITPEGEVVPLPLEIGSNSSLVSFELARDDTRLLVLVQTETGVRVLLGAITRDADCQPVALGEFVELGPVDGTAVDAAWIDDSRLAVVVKEESTGNGEVLVFNVSGQSSTLGRPLRPVTLVGGVGGVSGLRLLAEDGLIYQPRGNGWQATGERASVLATQR